MLKRRIGNNFHQFVVHISKNVICENFNICVLHPVTYKCNIKNKII